MCWRRQPIVHNVEKTCIYIYIIMIYDTYVNYIRISFDAVMEIFWFPVDVSQSLDMFFNVFQVIFRPSVLDSFRMMSKTRAFVGAVLQLAAPTQYPLGSLRNLPQDPLFYVE